MNVRPAAVAGLFYPDDPAELKAAVATYIENAKAVKNPAWPKAIIAPHAGYMYSGPIAGSAYSALKSGRGTITRVILIGPAHRWPVEGLAISSAEAFATPLGSILVDREAVADMLTLPFVSVSDEAHAPEHALEVHLPFLREVLGEFKIVPLVVGKATAEQVGAALEKRWGGPETLIVISSDLSHFLDYEAARAMDAETADAIVHADEQRIGYHNALEGWRSTDCFRWHISMA